ncbi:sulfurtransferase [Mycobacteroides abscessus]|uniref:sulfurtransferase n=1 Tax=Mycobacteroides abscessus TaxID=36809 RepID=UPI00092A1235|nr:sulfurtransferase [Mycobacteroides abscessus]SHQ39469.1 Putative thiosulfate sulfurtransferase (SseB) [Mycobacteroides abscessus subsp. abscessus]
MTALIAPAELLTLLAQHPIVIDVRSPDTGDARAAYNRGHVPGAHFADFWHDLVAVDRRDTAPGSAPLPPPDQLQNTLRRWGVHGDETIITVSDRPFWAARAWFVLRAAGLVDVRVLDGGWQRWVADGHPVSSDPPPPREGTVTVEATSRQVIDASRAATLADDGVLFDARDPRFYRGEDPGVAPGPAGHIPGARNVPASALYAPDGTMQPAALLRELFARLGVVDHTSVGVYCGAGISATALALAVNEAGHSAEVYVGSWSDWVNDPTRPVATTGDAASPTATAPSTVTS